MRNSRLNALILFAAAFCPTSALARGPAYPNVETVEGRQAVTFDGNDFLLSTFRAPAEITGNHPFTVAVWAFNPKISGEECMVEWAHRETTARAAQINYGNARDWGAVTHWTPRYDIGYDGGVPEAGQWHHIAVTYEGGVDGLETVWVDGVLNTSETKTLNLWTGDPVRLGSTEKGHWFSGSLASVQMYDYALNASEIGYLAKGTGIAPRTPLVALDATGLSTGTLTSWVNNGTLGGGFGDLLARDPAPADGETLEDLTVTLRWSPGDLAVSYDVYFGSERSRVEKARNTMPNGAPADSKLYKGRKPAGGCEYGPISLEMGRTYYWRIDGVDKAGQAEWRGPVWKLTVSTGQAKDPTPRNRIAAVPVETAELRWKPGKHAVLQNVYFGSNREEVANSKTPLRRNLPPEVTNCRIPVSPLEYGTEYYWRVDEINRADLPSTPGEVWSFRTTDQYVRDDITFFAVSDSHHRETPAENELQSAAADRLNSLPGTEYPADLGGGIVRTPRGVLCLGDLIDDGALAQSADQWRLWVADFGVNGEGRVSYPVYEAYGNHDLGPSDLVQNSIRDRNRRRPGVTKISGNGLHCSWDWDQVHFVNVNLYPGNKPDPATPYSSIHDPKDALDFLVADLAANVGNSGRPVIVCQHYDLQGTNWWTETERDTYYEAIKDYNVVAIIHGHTGTAIYTWKGIDVINDGNLGASVFVFHITRNELIVAQRKSDDTWGMTLRKPITGIK